MHQSFTGTSRKNRQVNLSGRNLNPWAALSGSQKTNAPTPGTHSTVAQAQAERAKRQQERERLNASKTIQRVWRGYASRYKTSNEQRQEWDRAEAHRLDATQDGLHSWISGSLEPVPWYASTQQCLSQLRLLVRFTDYRLESDRMRLLFFGSGLSKSLDKQQFKLFAANATSDLSRLGYLTIFSVKMLVRKSGGSEIEGAAVSIDRSLRLLNLLCRLIPTEMSSHSAIYYSSLQEIFTTVGKRAASLESFREALVVLLRPITPKESQVYLDFASSILSETDLVNRLAPFHDILNMIDFRRLAHALATSAHRVHPTSNHSLWLLANFVYLHGEAKVDESDVVQLSDYITVLALLLSRCADHIVAASAAENGYGPNEKRKSLPQFINKQILSLCNYENMSTLIMQIVAPLSDQATPVNPEGVQHIAKASATYVLTLLRVFPGKANDIRMWLYQGSASLSKPANTSTIQFFWNAARATNVFERIMKNYSHVQRLLFQPTTNFNDDVPNLTHQEREKWRDEWMMILLFFELYTFVLKIMDDEEFFSLSKWKSAESISNASSRRQKGALPLSDIADMILFLKNLAFTLHWNTEEISNTAGLAEIENPFSQSKENGRPLLRDSAGMHGISQDYLKELATGVLRMLHERDSRRNFLPDVQWLMTSHILMNGFIPAVVQEEERHHQLDDGDDAEEDPLPMDEDKDQHEEQNNPYQLVFNPFNQGRLDHSMPQARNVMGLFQPLREQEKMKKKRQMEMLGPRLEVLRNLPFFIPFETRVQIFREFVFRDQTRRRNGHVDPDEWRGHLIDRARASAMRNAGSVLNPLSRHHARIRRESIFHDALDAFYPLKESLKEPIRITFIDKFGDEEPGLDGGGVTKEFLNSITTEAFDPDGDLGLFVENDQHFVYPNPNSFEAYREVLRRDGERPGSEDFNNFIRDFLRMYEFLGRIVGKCLYEGILIDVKFAGFFLLKWALTGGSTTASNESAYRANINDLRDLDEQLYQQLINLKNWPGDVSELSLDFTLDNHMTLNEISGKSTQWTSTHELILHGSNTIVTNANLLWYIDRVAKYRLQLQPQAVTNAFLRGLGQIIQPLWLSMFNQRELQKLIGGDSADLDIEDLRRNTVYGGLYQIGDDGLEHPAVAMFWQVLRDMNEADRRKVLKFITSTPRAPLLGFSHLYPKFSINPTAGDPSEQDRLPSASTCFNLLKLPRYATAALMKEKLLYAAHSGAGFDFS